MDISCIKRTSSHHVHKVTATQNVHFFFIYEYHGLKEHQGSACTRMFFNGCAELSVERERLLHSVPYVIGSRKDN